MLGFVSGVSVSDGESYRLKGDRERVNKLQSQWVQTERELMELEVKVQHRNPEVCKSGGIMSPIGEAVDDA